MNLKKPKISKKKIVIFSVFLFIATIFWFLNALNKEYITKIDYPVSFYNFPKNVATSSNSPDALTLSLKAHGFDILLKPNLSKPLHIDIQKYAEVDKSDDKKLTINTNKLIYDFFPEIPGINIISIKPEIIVFETKKVFSKTVPVKLNITFSGKELYMQSGDIRIAPDSVTLYASKDELDKYTYAESEFKDFSALNSTLNTTLKLKKYKQVNFSESLINIIIPIERFTEKTSVIPIYVQNCPDSLNLITFPKETKVTYRVTLNRFDSISIKEFKLIADYKDIINLKSDKLQIRIVELPKFIESVKLSPEFIEFVLERRK